jgi:hypothetical protein
MPPPLPPENPDSSPANTIAALLPELVASGYSPPQNPENRVAYTPKSKVGKDQTWTDGGKSSLPNRSTVIHVIKWVLPMLGVILFLAKWGYRFYAADDDMDQDERLGAAHTLVYTYHEAKEAKAPQIENVRDPARIVRLLVRGVYGGGSDAGHEFKAELTQDEADDALEMLTWREGDGLTFKQEYREHRPDYMEVDDTTVPAGEYETPVTKEEDGA